MQDDRAIKPDQKYLQQAENKYQNQKKKTHSYLKKRNQEVLPCHLHLNENVSEQKQKKRSKKKTKAEQYEQLKEKNRSRFGEWKSKRQKRQEQENKKKIDPKKITVNYKPKKFHIDTQQYKKQGYTGKRMKKDDEEEDRIQYKKMLAYMKKQMIQLDQEKDRFNKQKQGLKFKKNIQNTQGFLQIRSKVNDKWQFKKQNINQSNKKSKKNDRQNQQLEIINEKKQKDMKTFCLTIDKIHQCPKYDLNSIYSFIDKNSILFYNNKFYREGIEKAENERNNGKIQNFEEKRISQFSDGWYQIWYPGKKRILGNKHYKVIWFSNGDVKQTFPNKYETYYCQKTRVIQIENKQKQKIWYFPQQDQLERNFNNKRQVIFSDGRHEIIQIE